MRRVIILLKYTPAALCGLLVIAWIGSFFIAPVITIPVGKTTGRGAIYLENRSVCVMYQSPLLLWQTPLKSGWDFGTIRRDEHDQWTNLLGFFEWHEVEGTTFWDPTYFRLRLPIPLLLLLAIPFAVAPLTRFRLPLWSWFAWTAAIAAALVYYTRLPN